VRFELRAVPAWITDCNCSVCRRICGLWAHGDRDDIAISRAPDATIAYVWGDRTLARHTCRTCGCTTHWESLQPEVSRRMAVNLRMAEPEAIKSIRVRRFDGADTWVYLD
jgi:hypothetical protein